LNAPSLLAEVDRVFHDVEETFLIQLLVVLQGRLMVQGLLYDVEFDVFRLHHQLERLGNIFNVLLQIRLCLLLNIELKGVALDLQLAQL